MMNATPVAHTITMITTNLPTPEGRKAELIIVLCSYLPVKCAHVEGGVANFVDGVDFSSVEQQVFQLTRAAVTTHLDDEHSKRLRSEGFAHFHVSICMN